MAFDPDLEMQGTIVTALKADTVVQSLVGQRVFDQVPKDAIFPYVSYGPVDTTEDDPTCIEGANLTIQLDCWSRAGAGGAVGFPEVKKIACAVRDALHDKDFDLAVNALVFIEHRQTRVFRDPDGLTSHAAISLEAYVERRD